MRFFKNSMVLVGLATATLGYADTMKINQFFFSSTPAYSYIALGDTVGLKSDFESDDYFTKEQISNQRLVKSTQLEKMLGKHPAYVLLTAKFDNSSFNKASIKIDGIKDYSAKLDGKDFREDDVKLLPGTHTITLSFLYEPGQDIKPEITVDSDKDGAIETVFDAKRMVSLDDFLYGSRIYGASMSPAGNYFIASYSDTDDNAVKSYTQKLFDSHTGKKKHLLNEYMRWMPKSEKMWTIRNDYHLGRHIVVIDPGTLEEQILASNIPAGDFEISPTEDFLIYRMVRKGPKEDKDVYRVVEPDDRQPGWRDRAYPAIYRFSDKKLVPLVKSKENIETLDISDDGNKLLLMASTRRMTERPTTLYSVIQLDLSTMKADTLVDRDGYVSGAYFSPDAKKIVVTGSPESFDRVGCTLTADVTPSLYDMQLYLLDTADKSVTPLTRNLDPSINGSEWSRYDNKIYLTATDKDKYTLYRLDPLTAEYNKIDLPEDVIYGLSVSRTAPVMTWWGQGVNNSDGLYLLNATSGTSNLVDRPSQDRLKDLKLSTCENWTFRNSRGDTVYGVYYVPEDFDPNKKYPLIVNYYGGCSPCTRSFESRYPLHLYAAMGYIVLQLEPSGATGFGQEWSSRHVSTAGKGVAEDIIEGTKQFCKEMSFVNPDKIGCIGASYGGFMTQYLQTQTDIFAAAISHAGISDHTSYWGEGYWGYSYSETSMGKDLPWTSPDLYVKQSPLYNANKINTPILFLHGDSDHNVPVGESIQMFTALQRLGKESAMVLVSDEDHHITEHSKRKKWQNTIFAWFAKYLQDDPSWWQSMYPDHSL